MNQSRKYLEGDIIIWVLVFILTSISLLAVYSSTTSLAYKMGSNEYYLFKHLGILILGLVLMYFAHKIKYIYYAPLSYLMLFIAVPVLAYILISGPSINQAHRWAILPIIKISFQPSDMAKLALIIYTSWVLSQKKGTYKSFKELLWVFLPVILICGLILPSNLSTAMMLFFSIVIIMFIARVNLRYIFYSIGIAAGLFALFLLVSELIPDISRQDTWENRMESFLGNADDEYQLEQSKIAIASGGIFGKGPGNSEQKNFLPASYSDFIYAIIIEEYGIVGGGFIVVLYIILFYRCIRIMIKSQRNFGAILTFGLSFSIILQAFVNMLVTVDLLPVTGQPLPLISMGGTSIWFNSISIGIILSVSKKNDAEEKMIKNI